MVDVQVAGLGEGFTGVWVVPFTPGYNAAFIPFELHRYLTCCDENLCPGVLAIPILVNPVGPFGTIVQGNELSAFLLSLFLGFLRFLMVAEAGLPVAVIFPGLTVCMPSCLVLASRVGVGRGGRSSGLGWSR